jgi:hypothetical protein
MKTNPATQTLLLTNHRTPRDNIGHDPRAPYIERFWLPLIGPSAAWLVRLAAYGFDTTNTYQTDATALAQAIGIRTASRLNTTFNRLEYFGLATPTPGQWALRAAIPWLDNGHVRHLTPNLKTEHGAWIQAFEQTHPELADLRAAAAQLDEYHRKNTSPQLINQIVAKHYAHIATSQMVALAPLPIAA